MAKGFSPYVGEVVAIDKSEEMLSLARANAPPNIVFHKGEVGACDVGTFDIISVGRALRYMPREPTVRYFESVLLEGGAVVTCAAAITKATSWRNAYNQVRRHYGYRSDAFSFQDTEYFAATPFEHANTVRTQVQTKFTLDSLVANALSFRSSYDRIRSNVHQFRAELETALDSFIDSDGSLEGVVGSAAFIFRKS